MPHRLRYPHRNLKPGVFNIRIKVRDDEVTVKAGAATGWQHAALVEAAAWLYRLGSELLAFAEGEVDLLIADESVVCAMV